MQKPPLRSTFEPLPQRRKHRLFRLFMLAIVLVPMLSIAPVPSRAATSLSLYATATYDDTYIYYQFSYTGSYRFYRVYIDADDKSETGFRYHGIGSEYMLEKGLLHRYLGANNSWEWSSGKPIIYTNAEQQVNWVVARQDQSLGDITTAKVVYDVDDIAISSSLPLTKLNTTIVDARADNTSTQISYQFSYQGAADHNRVYIDADRRVSTGYSIAGIGSDYLLEDDTLFAFSDSNWQKKGTISFTQANGRGRWTVDRATLNELNPCNETADIVFQVVGSTNETSPVVNQRYQSSITCDQQKIAVPAYFDGFNDWPRLESGAPTVGMAVFNPSSGPGTVFDPYFAYQIASAQAKGIIVLGYVATGYGIIRPDGAKADIDKYYQWYPQIDGIFLDEVPRDCVGPDDGYQAKGYQELYDYIQARRLDVGRLQGKVVLNVNHHIGNDRHERCMLGGEAGESILLTMERPASTYLQWNLDDTAWERKYPANRFWHVVWKAETTTDVSKIVDHAKANNAGWVYAIDRTELNTYATLPPEALWQEQLASAAEGAMGSWKDSVGLPGMAGTFGTVYALANDKEGTVYAGGVFTSAGGTPSNHIAQWNGTQWSPMGTGLPHGVKAVAVDPHGVVYAAGGYDKGGSTLGGFIARWDGTRWSSLDGMSSTVTYLEGMVYALAIDQNNNVIVGGDFNSVQSVLANSVARWNPVTRTWSSLGNVHPHGLSGWVEALAIGQDGSIYAGGTFGTGEEGAHLINVARWDVKTQTWAAVGGGTNGAVGAITIDRNGTLYIGGLFTEAGGMPVKYIAAWNGRTKTWSAMKGGVNDQVFALAAARDGSVYVGGRHFTQAGGVAANNIARWDTATETWTAVARGAAGPVSALTLDATDALFLGGDFMAVGGEVRVVDGVVLDKDIRANFVAKWVPSLSPQPLTDSVVPTSTPISTATTPYTFPLVVTGNFFVRGAQIRWGGLPLKTTAFVSSTQLVAEVPKSYLSTAGPVEITVSTGDQSAPILSNPQLFFVTANGSAVTSIDTATSTTTDGTAAATTGGSGPSSPGSVSAVATGSGSVTVGQYDSQPVDVANLAPSFNYFDVFVSPNSSFEMLTVQNCNLGAGNVVYWWNETAEKWDIVSNFTYDESTKCVTMKVTNTTSPSLLQLRGTIFGVATYAFIGFFEPVDNGGIYNQLQAGRAIPIKFSLGGNHGPDIFASGSPASQKVECSNSARVDAVEEMVAATTNSLAYTVSTDRYVYVWKTNSAWAGTCRQFILTLKNGAEYRANFKFTK